MAAEGSRQPSGSLSLRARALRLLARREHSRAELRRKLLTEEVDDAALDILLDDLESKKLLSDRRFAEVLARSKGARYGVASVAHSLSKQGVAPELAAAALAPLSATERERALAIWRRRFGAPPTDLKSRARQHRFMLGRGFEPATISWIIKHARKSPGEDS